MISFLSQGFYTILCVVLDVLYYNRPIQVPDSCAKKSD